MPVRLVVCLPGSNFSDRWLEPWNGLYSQLLQEYDFEVACVYGSGNNIYDVRNSCLEKIKKEGLDPELLLWIDSDNVVSYEGFKALRESLLSTADYSAVGAWYLFADKGKVQIAAGKGSIRPAIQDIQAANGRLLEVEYIGFGFLLMRYSLIEAAGPNPFRPYPLDWDQYQFETDDASFCVRAVREPAVREYRARFFLHSGVHSPHLKLQPVPLSQRVMGDVGDGCRLLKHEDKMDLYDTPLGEFWVPAGDLSLPPIIDEQLEGIYGPVNRGDIVLDCGANVGVFTKYACKREASWVVAIEPNPILVECLKKNIEDRGVGSVAVIEEGLWDSVGTKELCVGQFASAGSMLLDRGGPRTLVPVTMIDKIVEELDLPRVDMIKMDIEGAEVPALLGAENTIKRFAPRMAIACEHFLDDATTIPALIKRSHPDYEVTSEKDGILQMQASSVTKTLVESFGKGERTLQ